MNALKLLSLFRPVSWVMILSIALCSCKKTDTLVSTPSANIVVTNVVVGGGADLTFNPTITTVSLNSFNVFPLSVGDATVNLTNNSVSPATVYYDGHIKTVDQGNYSLFLSGVSPAAVDAVLITESYQRVTDSLCGVRFINLCPGSNPVSVNLAGMSNGSEASGLVYQHYSDFKLYPAKSANASYTFEIRDATTGTLLTTYTMVTPYFHYETLVLHGIIGGSPGIGVTPVLHPY